METLTLSCDSLSVKELPLGVQYCSEAWRAFKAASDSYRQAVDGALKKERDDRAIEENEGRDFELILNPRHTCIDDCLENVRESVCLKIIHIAESRFSPDGARLSIGDCQECEAAGVENFDPVGLWRYLERTYSGSGGERSAYNDVVRTLRETLSIKRGQTPRLVGGRLVVEHRISGGDARMSYDTADGIRKILNSFKAVGAWAEMWETDHSIAVSEVFKMLDAARNYSPSFRAPVRSEISGIVLIVPFKSKWEFRLVPDFAEKIQLFMAEFDSV